MACRKMVITVVYQFNPLALGDRKMMRPFFWIIFFLLLTGMLTLPFRAQQFKAPQPICIHAGGSIDPQTAMNQCPRDYHMLTKSIITYGDGIRINANNIVPGGATDPATTEFPISLGFSSYIVSVTGSTYSLTNGTTGQILEQSSNASQIFNDVYGNLTGGGTVYVCPGLYSLNGTIYPTSNTITSGAGESSVLSLSNTTAQPIMILNNVQNVKILYLKLTHNFPIVWGSTTKTMNTYDIQALNTTNLEIAYCHVTQSADYAISIGCVPSPNVVQLPCYNTNVHDNIIENSASDGLHYRGGSGHIIKSNIFNATGDDELGIAGLPWDRISDVTVESNMFEDGNANAIKFTTEQGLDVANVTIDQITGVNIMGNTIDTMNGGGIWIWVPQTSSNYTTCTVFCSNVSITDNMIRNTNLPAFLGDAGRAGCLLQGLTFSGNTISHCGNNGNGLWKDGSFFYSVTNSIITGNTFSRCGTPGYYSIDLQNGTNDIISNNMVANSNGYGMQDLNGGQNLFTSNYILFSFAHGFAVNNATDDLIQNNYIEGSGQGALGDGIVYTGTNGTIMGNKIIGGGPYQRYALNIHSGSVNTVVSDNDLRNVTTTSGAINDAGINTSFIDDIAHAQEYNSLQSDLENLNSTYESLLTSYASLQTNYSNVQTNLAALNSSYLDLKTNYDTLSESYNSLNASSRDYQQTTQNELANIKNTLYAFIAITAILAVALAYVATRKRKTKPET